MAIQKGITSKFMVIVSVVTVLLLTFLTFIVIQTSSQSQMKQAEGFKKVFQDQIDRESRTLTRKLEEKGKSFIELMALTAAPLILGYDFVALQELADNAQKDADIISTVFFDPDGNPLTTISEQQEKNAKKISQEISVEGDVIGSLKLELSLDLVRKLKLETEKRSEQIAAKTKTDLQETKTNLLLMVVVSAVIGVLVLCLAIFFTLRRYVVKPVENVATGLMQGAQEVTGASSQLEAASQELAAGATEQAASLEETSAALEELLAMTRSNSDNSRQGDLLMKEARHVVEQASVSMEKQTEAMTAISRSSEETSKIIKTIDEIAFQTNLLALNAAVEAARAGEAGAGFAVVAEEVRNLAMRAADAAKDTEKLIADIVAQVGEGASIVQKTNEEFSHMSEKIMKVGTLVTEIANASNEQVEGFGQISDAMTGIDQVTLQNSSNAEQSASSAIQMHAQAESLENFVGELLVLIGKGSKALEKGRADENVEPETNQVEDDAFGAGKRQDRRKVLAEKTSEPDGFDDF